MWCLALFLSVFITLECQGLNRAVFYTWSMVIPVLDAEAAYKPSWAEYNTYYSDRDDLKWLISVPDQGSCDRLPEYRSTERLLLLYLRLSDENQAHSLAKIKELDKDCVLDMITSLRASCEALEKRCQK